MKKIFLALVALCFAISIQAEVIASGTCGAEGDGGNVKWELTDDSVLTISGSGEMKDYIYYSNPAPWRSKYNSKIKLLKIEEGVTRIGSSAFYTCSINSAELPNSILSIGDNAFDNCRQLEEINIPNSVTAIGCSVFIGCTSLPVIDGVRYADTYMDEVVDKDNYKIKSGIKFIGTNAFCGVTLSSNFEIPQSVIGICNSAFSGCTGLTSITIPNSVTIIGEKAFKSCTSLTDITIGNSITSISANAFEGCTGLMSITIPNSVTSIEKNAFINCSGLKLVKIPNSVTSIGESAFWGCSSLASVDIPNSVTNIGGSAFRGCTNLEEVYVNWKKPLSIVPEVFDRMDGYYLLTLCVPTGTKGKYELVDVWKSFYEIVEYDNTETDEERLLKECDTNGDGKVNATDIMKIYNYILSH